MLTLSDIALLFARTLQGGGFDAAKAQAFIALPGARAAVMLRQGDDLAKPADLHTPPLEHFLSRAECCALEHAGSR